MCCRLILLREKVIMLYFIINYFLGHKVHAYLENSYNYISVVAAGAKLINLHVLLTANCSTIFFAYMKK